MPARKWNGISIRCRTPRSNLSQTNICFCKRRKSQRHSGDEAVHTFPQIELSTEVSPKSRRESPRADLQRDYRELQLQLNCRRLVALHIVRQRLGRRRSRPTHTILISMQHQETTNNVQLMIKVERYLEETASERFKSKRYISSM